MTKKKHWGEKKGFSIYIEKGGEFFNTNREKDIHQTGGV